MGYTVAIVGRPNVGKSTLFNRLIGRKEAIVDDISGVTRDRQYGTSEWNGKQFNVIDTGGFVMHSNDIFEAAIRQQVEIALEEASVIMFMVDVTTGITDLDYQMTELLRKSKKPVIVAVNKVDNNRRHLEAAEFYALGFKEIHFLSSISGSGTGELLDAVAEHIDLEQELETDLPKIAVIGQPNVGKSSMLNAFIGEERNIVTDIAGTTRDAIHSVYKKYNREFVLIDTAGIRKKNVVKDNLEFYSVIRAINAIDESDVCVLMIDATLGIEGQDLAIFRLAHKKRKGIVVAVNKWDLIEKDTNTILEYDKFIREKLKPFTDVKILFVSALEKQRIHKLIDEALDVEQRRKTKITTSALNNFFEPIIEQNPPPAYKGKYVKIKYITQLPLFYPSFAFFCNLPQYVRAPYKQFLENKLREGFDLTGVPISIHIRKK